MSLNRSGLTAENYVDIKHLLGLTCTKFLCESITWIRIITASIFDRIVSIHSRYKHVDLTPSALDLIVFVCLANGPYSLAERMLLKSINLAMPRPQWPQPTPPSCSQCTIYLFETISRSKRVSALMLSEQTNLFGHLDLARNTEILKESFPLVRGYALFSNNYWI